MNVYATPAAITLLLLVVETMFLIAFLPETRGTALRGGGGKSSSGLKAKGNERPSSRRDSAEGRIKRLSALRNLHLMFLVLFSGVEFTLTFLTFDRESQIPSSPFLSVFVLTSNRF